LCDSGTARPNGSYPRPALGLIEKPTGFTYHKPIGSMCKFKYQSDPRHVTNRAQAAARRNGAGASRQLRIYGEGRAERGRYA
jgi:hypothetical protein